MGDVRIDAPIGITNMMGSAFTENPHAIRPVLGALTRSASPTSTRARRRDRRARRGDGDGVAAATNDRFLDEPETPANIRRNLDDLAATAKRRGHAIGYARATPETISQLEAWSAELEGKGCDARRRKLRCPQEQRWLTPARR